MMSYNAIQCHMITYERAFCPLVGNQAFGGKNTRPLSGPPAANPRKSEEIRRCFFSTALVDQPRAPEDPECFLPRSHGVGPSLMQKSRKPLGIQRFSFNSGSKSAPPGLAAGRQGAPKRRSVFFPRASRPAGDSGKGEVLFFPRPGIWPQKVNK